MDNRMIDQNHNQKWDHILDAMIEEGIVDENYSLPIHWEVCPTCGGEGTHVNPSIDGNGLTASDFAEDPDFKEDYFSGVYDVQCYTCRGRSTVQEVDFDALPDVIAEFIREWERAEAYYQAERDAETRMGC